MLNLSITRSFTACVLLVGLVAAEGSAPIAQTPDMEAPNMQGMHGQLGRLGQSGMDPARQSMRLMPPRTVTSFEVEALVLNPTDVAGVAGWAVLAAEGFHVVSATADVGKQILLLERMSPPGGGAHIPAVVERDVEATAVLRERLESIALERRSGNRPVHAHPPVVAPALMAPPLAPAAIAPASVAAPALAPTSAASAP